MSHQVVDWFQRVYLKAMLYLPRDELRLRFSQPAPLQVSVGVVQCLPGWHPQAAAADGGARRGAAHWDAHRVHHSSGAQGTSARLHPGELRIGP